MATKTTDVPRPPQELVSIKPPEVETKVPDAYQKKAEELAAKLVANLQAQTDDYAKRMTAEIEKKTGPGVEAGTTITGFHHWDCLTYGPWTVDQISGLPSRYMPNKIVAAGDWALMIGLIWINPVAPPFSPPPTLQLGGRQFSARFETINLSTVEDGPDGTPIIVGTTNPWPSPAPVITPLIWWQQFPDPGATPHLYEVTLTVDLTLSNQPYAAFSTWHYDPDVEPGFLWLPGMPPRWEYEHPARFLVYHR